jgi:hypothetical protein
MKAAIKTEAKKLEFENQAMLTNIEDPAQIAMFKARFGAAKNVSKKDKKLQKMETLR